MSDEPQSDPQTLATAGQNLEKTKTGYRNYSAEDKFTVLAAYDIMEGNVYRVAIAYGVPHSTVNNWVKEREASGRGPSNLEKERRGSLAAKLESKLHDVIESITPEVIRKATLSQRGVFFGIGHDKLNTMQRNIEPDPAVELARILGCSVKQLPPTLQLEPGEEIPEGFGPILDAVASPNNPDSFEAEPAKPAPPDTYEGFEPHSDTCPYPLPPPLSGSNNRICNCGAFERNRANAQALIGSNDDGSVN